MPKGQAHERFICHRLSKWWTGKEDSVFWRTANSGGRATVRKGKATKGQHGDLTSTCPESAPFTELLVVEMKRGYSKNSAADLLDKPKKRLRRNEQPTRLLYEQWFEKAEHCQKASGAYSWIVIVKRDRKEPVVFLPQSLKSDLQSVNAFRAAGGVSPFLHIRYESGNDIKVVLGMLLEDFLEQVEPKHIVKLLKKVR